MFLIALFSSLVLSVYSLPTADNNYIDLNALNKRQNHLIILVPTELTCYASSVPNLTDVCESNKCLIKAAVASNSSISIF
jgi:hypothetical protein